MAVIIILVILVILVIFSVEYYKRKTKTNTSVLSQNIPTDNGSVNVVSAPIYTCEDDPASTMYGINNAQDRGLDISVLRKCNGEWFYQGKPTCIATGNATDTVPNGKYGAPAMLVAMNLHLDTDSYYINNQIGPEQSAFYVLQVLSGDPADNADALALLFAAEERGDLSCAFTPH